MSPPGEPARRRGSKKQKAWRFGRAAETLSAWSLRLKGYRVLARGYRVPAGEIDIVALRGSTVVFVEVKARRDRTAAADSLRRRQTARIVRAAQAFLQAHPRQDGLDVRFDVILVSPWRWPLHLVDAWRPEP